MTPSAPNKAFGRARPLLERAKLAKRSFNRFNGPTVSNGILQTTFAGTNGQHAALDTSADLRTWTPLTTNLIGATGLLNLPLTNHPGQKPVFYRLRSY